MRTRLCKGGLAFSDPSGKRDHLLAHLDTAPATGQNQRLMKFAGQKVAASGKVFEKGGSRALVIEKIEAESAGK
jgi:hypothetical protein